MKNKVSVYILVIAIAFVLWIQQMLLKTHIQELLVSVIVENIPAKLVLLEEKKIEIPVTIEARGMDLMFLRFSKIVFLLDGKDYFYGKNDVNVSSSDLTYPDRIKLIIKNILYKNNLSIYLDKLTKEKKSIELKYASTKDEEFFLKNKISNLHKKVEVEGPKSLINKFRKIPTESISKKMLKDDKLTVKLISPDERLKLTVEEITFEIEKIRQITRTISLIPISYPLNMNIAIIPQKVSAMIRGPEDIVNKLNNKKITARIDPNKIKKNNFTEVNFELPAGVKLIEYTPRQIQIIRND